MATPGGEELDEGGLAGLQDNLVEVVGDEIKDGGLGCHGGSQTGEHEALDENHDDLCLVFTRKTLLGSVKV